MRMGIRKIVLGLLIGFASLSVQAVTIKVIGEKGAMLFESKIESQIPSDVGTVSVLAFDLGHVDYEGDSSSISKIYNLGQNIEVVSDTEMKAHGWCFAINGQVPETMPDKTEVLNQDTTIEWYYAYAHYKDGDWIGQCVRD